MIHVPMVSEELRRAIEILDGTNTAGRDLPTEPGYFYSPRGSRLVIEAGHAPALKRAVRAELVLFGIGTGRLTCALAVRLFDAAGGATPWAYKPYAWSLDPGKWHVPPVADPRLIPYEERVLELVALDAETGRPAVTRTMPLSDTFALALRNRVEASRNSNSKPEWVRSQVGMLERVAAGGLERVVGERFTTDLLPIPALDASTGTTPPVPTNV